VPLHSPPVGNSVTDGLGFAHFLLSYVKFILKESAMRRFISFVVAPMALAGLIAAGCGSSSQETSTNWNDSNPWGTQRASQAGGSMDPGTGASLPPATQPAR
jgi:hypothetical protein